MSARLSATGRKPTDGSTGARTDGRKRAMTDEQIEQAKAMMANPKLNIKAICQTLGVSKATLYKYAPAHDTNGSRKK